MTDLSMHNGIKPDWPLNAVPRLWVERLFAKMAAFYGDKFANMWRGANIEEVQKAWAVEMHKLANAQLKAGVDSLTALPKPPTLPEFLNLCRQARIEQVSSAAPRLENQTRADEKTVDSNVARMKGIVKNVRLAKAHPGWAFDICLSGQTRSREKVTVDTWKDARTAILSDAGRSYATSQTGDRGMQCLRVMNRVIHDENSGISRYAPFKFTGESA